MLFLLLVIVAVSTIIYVKDIEISTSEFFKMVGAMALGVLFIYGVGHIPFPNDLFFRSGRILETSYHPYFVEQYQMAHTVCHSCGKNCTSCHTYYTTEYAKHQPYYSVKDTLDNEWKVNLSFHNEVKNEYGNVLTTTKPNKCTHGGHFYKGDPYLYSYFNETNSFKYPTNKLDKWHNPLKNSVSLFKSNSKIKRDYPHSINLRMTDRMQEADGYTRYGWDILNTKVYEKTKANLILVKVANSEEAKELENYWISGKQNDLVITVVGSYKQPDYVKVFGWSKSSLVKHQLEQSILQYGVDYNKIEHIVVSNYVMYDWTQFNYLTEKPSPLVFILALIYSIIVGILCYKEFSTNWESK